MTKKTKNKKKYIIFYCDINKVVTKKKRPKKTKQNTSKTKQKNIIFYCDINKVVIKMTKKQTKKIKNKTKKYNILL